MCVCVCVCVRGQIDTRNSATLLVACPCVSLFVCLSDSVYGCVCVHVTISVCVCVCACVCLFSECVCVCVCVCVQEHPPATVRTL